MGSVSNSWYWSVSGRAWQSISAIDEFGAGTLDGDPTHGPSYDACAAAAIENGRAAFEGRPPSYVNIGLIRADMITHGRWTANALVSNPRTNGAYIENIFAEINVLGAPSGTTFHGLSLLPAQSTTLAGSVVESVMSACRGGDAYAIFMIENAAGLSGNEQGVHGHFVGVAAYDAGKQSMYILNSDVAGQHGLANGQWVGLGDFLKADPRGYCIMFRTVAPPPPPPPPPVDWEAKYNALLAAVKAVAANG